MKKNNLWLGILVLALVFGMAVIGCNNDDPADSSATYEGEDLAGNHYELTVTKPRAAYTPAKGDSYVLKITINGVVKTSSGTIESFSPADKTFTLQPNNTDVTFTIVISGKDIKSVTGNIAVTEGEPVTPRSFNTIYLRAWHWVNVTDYPGAEGELWSTQFLLSDLYPGTIKAGNTYKVTISGNANKKLEHIKIQFQWVDKDGGYWWLGSTGLFEIPTGSFNIKDVSLPIDTDKATYLNNKSGEIVVELIKVLWEVGPNGENWNNFDPPLSEDAYGAIMADISDYSISFE